MESLLAALTRAGPGAAIALKIFFSFLELLIIAAGIYLIRHREALFGYKGKESDSYASANLLWYPAKNVLTGVELLWGQLEQKDGMSNIDRRMQFSAQYKF